MTALTLYQISDDLVSLIDSSIDPDTGEVTNYNAAYFRPSEAVA